MTSQGVLPVLLATSLIVSFPLTIVPTDVMIGSFSLHEVPEESPPNQLLDFPF